MERHMALFELDHVTLGVRHLYAACHRLSETTGLQSVEGGWQHVVPTAHRLIPIPGDAYINVESVIDHYAPLPPPVDAFRRWFEESTRDGPDRWMTWCLRTRTYQDLEAVAQRFGGEVAIRDGAVRPDGTAVTSMMAPDSAAHTWARGLPNWYFHPDPDERPARRSPVQHRRPLAAVAWLEVGGDPAELEDHIGSETFASLPLRVVDGPRGLHGVGLSTADGDEIALRAESAAPDLARIAAELG
jgi:hypothetical protein